jgi:hypothetical protein
MGAKIKQTTKRQTWLIENPEGRRSRFRHPSGQQSKRAIPLPNNQMLNASVALAADNDNNLAAPRMEGIKDPHFNRRTPGIMTLVRPVSAKVGLPAPSATRPVEITARSSISACRGSSIRSR